MAGRSLPANLPLVRFHSRIGPIHDSFLGYALCGKG